MELVHIVAGGFTGITVGGHTPPDLILHHQHTDLFQLLAQLLDVIADNAVVDVHIALVVEHIEGAGHIDFQCRGDVLCLFFLLCPQQVVKVLQDRHILRAGVIEVSLIDQPHTAVNDGFLHRLQALFATHDQLTQGQDKICFQGNRIILFRIVRIDVHRIDILRAGRTDFNDLPLKFLHQCRVLGFRIAHDYIVIRHQERIGDFSLGRKRFAGTGSTKNQSVGVLELFPINHNQVVGQGIQPIVQSFFPGLKQLLGGKRHENRRAAGSHAALNLNQVLCQRQAAHQPLLLLEVQTAQVAIVLLCNAGSLKHIGFQFLLRLAGVHNQKGQQEHTLILTLQFLQQCLCILTVSCQIGRNDVHIVSGTDSFLLFLNLGTIQLRNGVLDGFDCFILVYRLNVHSHDLAGFHIQKILQHLIRQIGSRDLEIGHRTIHPAHLKNTVFRKGKTGRRNKILYRQPALRQPLPIEIESVMVTHVEHIVHQMKPFLAVQQFCPDTQAFEVVHQVDLNVNEPRLCLFHGFCFNAKRQVLRLGQSVVALGKLAAQHGAVLRAHRIEMILLVRDAHHLLKIRGIRSHIHKR